MQYNMWYFYVQFVCGRIEWSGYFFLINELMLIIIQSFHRSVFFSVSMFPLSFDIVDERLMIHVFVNTPTQGSMNV